MVGRVFRGTERKIGKSGAHGIAIDQDFLARAVTTTRMATHEAILTPLHVADIIFPWAVGHRHAVVVLLDAPFHLLKERRFEVIERRQDGVGVSVFGFQMLADILSQHLGLAHHLLPVLCAHPGVIIGP